MEKGKCKPYLILFIIMWSPTKSVGNMDAEGTTKEPKKLEYIAVISNKVINKLKVFESKSFLYTNFLL